MEIANTITTILNNPDVSKENKINTLSDINDYLEYGDIEKKKVIKDLNLLIKYVAKQTDDELKEETLNAITTGENYQQVDEELDIIPIIENIENFNDQCLSYVLSILGYSGKEQYRNLIESYKENPKLEDDVEDALLELDYRVKKY